MAGEGRRQLGSLVVRLSQVLLQCMRGGAAVLSPVSDPASNGKSLHGRERGVGVPLLNKEDKFQAPSR